MTIDNHPLTPKPVDDREAGVGYHQVLPVDRVFRSAMLSYIVDCLDRGCSEGDMPEDRNSILDQMIARHREQAERGYRDLVFRFIDRMNDVSPECGDGAERIVSEFAREANTIIRTDIAARKALDTRP